LPQYNSTLLSVHNMVVGVAVPIIYVLLIVALIYRINFIHQDLTTSFTQHKMVGIKTWENF
jgi:hypothetical protein